MFVFWYVKSLFPLDYDRLALILLFYTRLLSDASVFELMRPSVWSRGVVAVLEG